MTIATTLVDWAWPLSADAVPAAVRHAACRHLLDGLGTAVAAQRTAAAPAATAVAASFTAPQEATIIATRTRVPAPAAALANGTAVHALDYDDTHAGGLVHATAAVLPATFAVAEATGASGADALTTAIAGYETVTRLAAAAPHGFHARGFHATSVCGVFAAALVAARLSGLTRQEGVAALGIAGSQAAGSLEFLATGASTKQLHPGLAGAAGILAARLAAAGASAPTSILEGSRGLYAAYTDGAADLDGIARGLGADWQTTRITIKPYPACQLSHASLDALRELAPKIGDPSEVAAIVVDVPTESVAI
ncbi:MAG: MmgE/PrpD family protein, partial [Actinobacteria bacterium]|nr:MmgE/PrpD family protein [Actinomycetota bacterium]